MMLATKLKDHEKFRWSTGMRWVAPSEGGAPNYCGTVTPDTVAAIPKNAVPVLDDPATAGVLADRLTTIGGAVLMKEHEVKARAPMGSDFFVSEAGEPGVCIAQALLAAWG